MKAWLMAVATAAALAGSSAGAGRPQVITSDVNHFYEVYEAAHTRPDAAALQAGYLDRGSPGLHDFIENRIISADALSRRIAERPVVYEHARACLNALPRVRGRVATSMRRLARIYPEAVFPPITVVVGRDSSGGTSGPSGVILGLEVICRADQMQANLEDRFVHLIAHEYVHAQQTEPAADAPLLDQALTEGVAELVAELTSGQASDAYLAGWVKGRETAVGEAFLRDMDTRKVSDWLYNGVGTREKPGDLGYWVGYRIARSYYLHAPDKRAAVKTLIRMKDARSILGDSGWRPGL